jgi:2'-5' RNA ligase
VLSLTFDLDTFATRRRKVQDDALTVIQPLVAASPPPDWSEELEEAVTALYAAIYEDETGEEWTRVSHPGVGPLIRHYQAGDEDSDERATALMIVTATINAATMQAALDDEEDLFVEWVSMSDGAVRETHEEAHGQVRPVGDMFEVGEARMPHPGFPVPQIEEWLNCRCTVRPTLASAFSTEFVSAEERRNKPTMPGTDGKYPIGNCADLRKAIRLVGNSTEDTEKVKTWIRSSKKRLGCPEVEIPDTWSLELAVTQPANTSTVIVALPAEDDPVHSIGPEQKHATLLWFGEVEAEEAVEAIHSTALQMARQGGPTMPFEQDTAGEVDGLGDDDPPAVVLHMSSDARDLEFTLESLREGLLEEPVVREAWAAQKQWPTYTPHITLGYGDEVTEEDIKAAKNLSSVRFDRIAVWHRDQQTEYPLGGTVPEKEALVAAVGGGEPIPWFGVWTKEGVWTGDKRKFRKGSLSTRPLPLPFTWQKVADEGHKGNVTIGHMTHTKMAEGGEALGIEVEGQEVIADGGEMLVSGIFFESVPETDEAIGLLAEAGRFGVSVDADDTEFDFDEENEGIEFTKARVASACMLPIPAFHEGWVALGKAPWMEDEDTEEAPDEEKKPEGTEVPEDDMIRDDAPPPPDDDEEKRKKVAAAAVGDEILTAMMEKLHVSDRPADEPLVPDVIRTDAATVEFVDVAPGKTEDGPGWLTNPVDTDRIRDYWVSGPGAAKIGWGTAGDFNRCRAMVAEYVKPQHINGYCANRHYDALGVWPGPGKRGHSADAAAFDSPTVSLVAAGGHCAPSEWFTDPMLSEVTPLQVTKEGRVYGHVAEWKQCHLDSVLAGDVCTSPPRSETDYSFFLNSGVVLLDNDTQAAVGQISVGDGHAGPRMSVRGALHHYDSTSTAVADVTCGEDDHGIWVAGWIRPGTSDEMVTALRASDVSPDWREVRGNLEMIALLAVNVGGFGIPRPRVATQDGRQVSLVASTGMVLHDREETGEITGGETGIDYEALAAHVAAELAAASERKQALEAMAAEFAMAD